MKQKRIRLLALVLIVFMCAGVLYGRQHAIASSYDERIAAAQKRQKELEELLKQAEARKKEFQQKQAETKAYLEELSGDITKVQEYIEEVDRQMLEINDRLTDLNFRISEKEEELEKTKQELAEAIECQQDQYETMKKRIRYTYENGNESVLEVLAQSHDIADFLNRVEYRVSIAEYDNSLYERYRAATKVVITTKEYLEASINDLEDLKAEAEAEKAACEELAAKKGEQLEAYMAMYQIEEDLLEDYMTEIDNSTASISDLYKQKAAEAEKEQKARAEKEEEARRKAEEERKRKEEEARKKAEAEAKRKAEEAAAKKAAEEALKKQRMTAADGVTMTTETSIDRMIWPLPGDGRTFSGFGYRKAPLPGASTFHNGVDIGGEYGAKIVATLAGRVTVAGYNASGGNHVQIDHGNGVSTRYCHASKLLVKVGDYVLQGQPIALVGSTGISTGPHLHFTVIIKGTYVDPMKYIKYTGK